MSQFNLEKAFEYYTQEQNITGACKRVCQDLGIPYQEMYRNRLRRMIEKSPTESQSTTETAQYTSYMPSAWDENLNRFLSIEEFCDKYGLDKKTVKSAKLVSHLSSHMTYNICFFTPEEETILDIEKNLPEIIKKVVSKNSVVKTKHVQKDDDKFFDRLVFTDVHIAMDVQGKDGDPLYDGKWDREEILNRLDKMIEHTLRFKKSSVLYIDELGDFMDGLGGQTTRKGHDLPQNMNDKQAFELGLEFKVRLVDALIPYYDEIHCNILTNDNHAGVFGFFVAFATKQVLELRYPEKVFVNVCKRFIEHYSVGNHTFLIVHGKDSGEQKFGLKPRLDAVQMEKIDQYCKEHKLYNGNFIELSKGDSHQAIYDDTTSNDFQYYSYPAFSPPSNWVKTNFKNSKSGFRFYNIHREENLKIAIPYFF